LIFLAGLHLPLYSLSTTLSLWDPSLCSVCLLRLPACGGSLPSAPLSLSIPPPGSLSLPLPPFRHSTAENPPSRGGEGRRKEGRKGDSTVGRRSPQVSAGACTVPFFFLLLPTRGALPLLGVAGIWAGALAPAGTVRLPSPVRGSVPGSGGWFLDASWFSWREGVGGEAWVLEFLDGWVSAVSLRFLGSRRSRFLPVAVGSGVERGFCNVGGISWGKIEISINLSLPGGRSAQSV
jgi:hypothetical protein